MLWNRIQLACVAWSSIVFEPHEFIIESISPVDSLIIYTFNGWSNWRTQTTRKFCSVRAIYSSLFAFKYGKYIAHNPRL